MRPRPTLAELGDRWFTSEQSTAAGMIVELQRVLRRARAHWVAVLALAAVVSAGLVFVVVTKHRQLEAQVTLALTEGVLTGEHSGVPARELKEYVDSVLLSDQNLAEVIEKENLVPLRKKLGMPFALEQVRGQLEIEVWKNTFLYYFDEEATSRKSARIGITVLDRDPDRAYDTAKAIAAVMIRAHEEERARITGAVAEEVRLLREGLEAELATLNGEVSAQEATIKAARAKGNLGLAASLEVELVSVEQRVKDRTQMLSQVTNSSDGLADQISAAGLDVTLAVVDERRPDRPEWNTFALILVCCVISSAAVFGAAMIVSTFDTRIHDGDDLTRFRLPLLGHVPAFTGDRVGAMRTRSMKET
ncbi:MAG TPA: hypothetical protein VGM90_04570 [Kofleriaceae bacterium]|jgi:uncharacterized protein involved in exopolysaccharide biosynthesis